MKGLLLATALSTAYVALITAVFQCWTLRHKAAVMTGVHLLTLPCLIAAHLLTPADLGFLPAALARGPAVVDLGFGLLVYSSGYFGGLLQLYNLADRGLSLRVLIDIEESPGGRTTAAALCQGYSGGRGLVWMYDKRLADLVAGRFVEISDGLVRNTQRGTRVASNFGRARKFLRMDDLVE
jgi:hypothetical protein